MSPRQSGAAHSGLLVCHSCRLLSKAVPGSQASCCPRCGARLHFRKPDSIARTWAFLIAAMILYLPANVLPVMKTGSLFGAENDTILSGVVYLLDILVDPTPEMTLFDIGAIRHELGQLLGVPVGVLRPNALPDKFRAAALAEANPV